MNVEKRIQPLDESLKYKAAPFGDEVMTQVYRAANEPGCSDRGVIEKAAPYISNLRSSIEQTDDEIRNGIHAAFMQSDGKYHGLQTDDVMNKLSRMDHADFVDFLSGQFERWHDLQSSLNRDRDFIVADTYARAGRLEQAGLFPQKSLSRVEQMLVRYSTIRAIGSIERGACGYVGFHAGDYDLVAVTNLYTDKHNMQGVSEPLLNTGFHEHLHATGNDSQAGFMNSFVGEVQFYRWLEEAYVEHSTVASGNIDAPQVSTIIPTERIGGDLGSYPLERELLGVLSDKSEADLPADLLGEAYFSHPHSKARHIVYQRLSRYFSGIRGYKSHDGLTRFSEDYEESSLSAREDLLKYVLYEIYGFKDGDINEFDEANLTDDVYDTPVFTTRAADN